MKRALLISLGLILIAILIPACSLLTTSPDPITTAERDALVARNGHPVGAPINVYWNDYRIPFIEAQSDSDAAYAIGYLQAHQRLGQIGLFRMISQGRITEMVGTFGTIDDIVVDFDRILKTFDFGKRADDIIANMNDTTLIFVRNFVKGINHYVANLDEEPVEYRLLGIDNEPFTLQDMATIWRMAGVDINLGNFFRYYLMMDAPNWEVAWEKGLQYGGQLDASKKIADRVEPFSILGQFLTKSGSNTIAVSGKKTKSGAAMIANDPHLGTSIPPLWMLMGVKSPSYHMVGFMIPGLPAVTLGRNPAAAWGGTNMRGISSYLYEIDEETAKKAKTREINVTVPWWFDEQFDVRETEFGPIISDVDMLNKGKDVALYWEGHQVSDEVTAFLKANKATTFEAFRQAFDTYGVSAQNMIYADTAGNIGHVLAFRQPIRKDNRKRVVLNSTDNPIVDRKKPTELPYRFNPEKGFLGSANNETFTDHPDLGWFYSVPDRAVRINQLLSKTDTVTIDSLIRWQLDTYSSSAKALQERFKEAVIWHQTDIPIELKPLWDEFRSWDGYYRKEQRSPVAFEVIAFTFSNRYYPKIYEEGPSRKAIMTGNYWKYTLADDLKTINKAMFDSLLVNSLRAAKPNVEKWKNWGDIHQMRLQHLFGPLNNIPFLGWLLNGDEYVFEQYPVDGHNDTMFKQNSGNTLGTDRMTVNYGANSRHISDLSDMDANYFVLFGGNDGWLTNPNLTDQAKLFKQGQMIQMPLRMENVRKQFKLHMTLTK